MDARSEGSWLSERREAQRRTSKPDRNPNVYVRMRANSYVQQIEKTWQAYRAHGGRKVMVRYEDLRADTLKTMKRIYSALEIPVEEAELARSVEKNSWENIPAEQKGEGKFHRKAKPGGWREDLTPEQAEIVEGVAGSLLRELYPKHRVGGSWCPSSEILRSPVWRAGSGLSLVSRPAIPAVPYQNRPAPTGTPPVVWLPRT
jgi:hypothetical protein